jgi:hypothetical protein
MKVKELAEITRGELRLLSGYNGKILCRSYDTSKHKDLGEREVLSLWPDIRISDGSFGNWAKPVLGVYVDGYTEAEKDFQKKNSDTK